MTPRRGARVVLAGLGVALGIAVVGLDVGLGHTAGEMLSRYTFVNAAFAWTFVPVGALILARHPGHRVGRIMVWVGLAAPVQILLARIAEAWIPPGTLFPQWDLGTQLVAWIPFWAWFPAVVPAVTLLPLHFPDGALPSPRWRPLRWAAWTVLAMGTIGFAFGQWPWDPTQGAATTAMIVDRVPGSWGTPLGVLADLAFPALGVVILGVLVSLGVRYRSTTGIQRDQLRWLLLGAVVALPLMLVGLLGLAAGNPGSFPYLAITLAVVPLPVAMGFAIVRHQLFDIDLVVSRSLVVAGLAAFITVVYVGIVVGLGGILAVGQEPNRALQVVATALVAVSFQPLRQHLRVWADRLVYGYRASPYETLAAFTRTATRTPDETTLAEIASLLAQGTGADPAVVWLRVGDRLHPVAAHPSMNGFRPLPIVDGAPPPVPGDVVVPVEHDGELLGALAVTKPRGESVTEPDHELTRQLAAGVGLALRNVRLTAELEERLAELHASRARIVRVQDEARQALERDLHDGAQQQLVAMKVKLGLATSLARTGHAPRTAALLADLAGEADHAVETLRDLARGIYPPLLEAEGLPAALTAQARKAPVPVRVHAAGVGRHPREVEAAIYFCVLEALQNIAKYAQATTVAVRLSQGDGLVFEVIDDGVGFDPDVVSGGTGLTGMRDRLDTVGGSVAIDSVPGAGTTVRGRVPATVPAEPS